MNSPTKKLTRTEMKATLLAKAEATIDELLQWTEETPHPNLTQIEDIVLQLRQAFGQALAETTIQAQDTVQPVNLPPCPKCGQSMQPKGNKGKTVVSRVGELPLARQHYYCPRCQHGLFPLDEQLQTWDAGWSEQVAQYAVWLYAQVDDQWAEQILGQIGGIPISDTSIWRRVKVWGEKIKAQEEAQRVTANALPARGAVIRGTESKSQDMGVAMDAAKIFIRDEGWKDLKAGCVFEIALRPERDQESGETVERAHAVANSYVGYLGGPEKFGGLMWAEACRRGLPQARDSIVLGDGAPWIWNLAGAHFGRSWPAVDWFHADEHLYKAANLLWGEGNLQTIRWVKGMEKVLYQGNAWEVAETLKGIGKDHPDVAETLQTEAGYFEGNKRRMQYLELREHGFPIGRGMVESACKQFRARFTGAGMRWSRPGAERLIPTRAAVMSHRFDEVWSNAYNSPRR